MAIKLFRINEFTGIDQSAAENTLTPSASPDACNMDTSMGRLSVAKGFVRHIEDPVPDTGTVHALYPFETGSGTVFTVCAGNGIYARRNGSWEKVYTYDDEPECPFAFAEAGIGNGTYLLIACGGRIVKFDGDTASPFGSAEGESDKNAAYLAMYRGRLFAAGDGENPGRLYWSCLPGSGRSIEDWGTVEASANVEGGHTEVGAAGSDPIVGLAALSNQLLIFKRRSVYRLIGDKPSNFIVEEVDSRAGRTVNTSLARVADTVYFMTGEGLARFNGVTAQPMGDFRKLCRLMEGSDVSGSMGAAAGHMLYFSASDAGGDYLIEYDLLRHVYMVRRGFGIGAICGHEGRLYLINDNRLVYRFNEGDSYDGDPVEAYWTTPETDLSDKSAIKGLRWLYMRGKSDGRDSAALVDVKAGGVTMRHRLLLPREPHEVLEAPLMNEGRVFSVRFANEAGGGFTIEGGIELEFDERRRTQ